MEVSKVPIARRLLDEAIRGRVRGDDVLTVHLGAMAAFMVTRDLRRHRGLGGASIEPFIAQGQRREFWKRFTRLNNALKHADNDPDAMIDIGRIDGLTEMVILLAADNLGALEPQAPASVWILYFRALFIAAHPGAIGDAAPAGWAELIREGIVAQLDHAAFLAFARDSRNPPAELWAFLAALEDAARAAVRPEV